MATLPSGSVTFVFTDIESSTALPRRLGERHAELIADHQRIVRESFGGHAGVEIDMQGDSFFFAFARARDAVAAAVEAQRAHAEHEWAGGEAVRVRMGPAYGERAHQEIASLEGCGLDGRSLFVRARGGVIRDRLRQGPVGVLDAVACPFERKQPRVWDLVGESLAVRQWVRLRVSRSLLPSAFTTWISKIDARAHLSQRTSGRPMALCARSAATGVLPHSRGG